MRLLRLVNHLATTVSHFGTARQRRFDDWERQELLEAVATAADFELLNAQRKLEPTTRLEGYPNREPLWSAPEDAAFLPELSSAIDARLKDPSVRPTRRAEATTEAPSVPKSSWAVLLIDAHYEKSTPELRAEQAHIKRVLTQANAQGVPVLEIVLPHYETDDRFARLRRDNWWRIEKTTSSVFESTNIDELLASLGARNLVVMGLNEDMCVRRSVEDAAKAGYSVYTSPELVHNSWDAGEARLPDAFYRDGHIHVVERAAELPPFA